MFKIIITFALIISLCEGVHWQSWDSGRSIPNGAFRGGYDGNEQVYVIRASHGGGILPGKYNPNKNYGYVSFNGHEIKVRNFDVLIANGDELTWEIGGGAINYVRAGTSGSGDPLYICRYNVRKALVPGKLHNGRCYVPYGASERTSIGNFAVLKYKNN